MKNNLLSIGEVSRLKGVGIKALRYYERIGVLAPALVDPQTGYRYYAMDQMSEIDVIATCVELGLPLKELQRFRSGRGRLDLDALLEHGHALARENLRRAQAIMVQVDGYRTEIALQRTLRDMNGPYERELETRTLLSAPWNDDVFNARRYIRLMTELYERAAADRLVPLYLQGMARLPESGGGSAWQVVLEVHAGEGALVDEDGLTVLPGKAYRGERIVREDFGAAFQEAFAVVAREPSATTALALDLWDDELRSDSFALELLRG